MDMATSFENPTLNYEENNRNKCDYNVTESLDMENLTDKTSETNAPNVDNTLDDKTNNFDKDVDSSTNRSYTGTYEKLSNEGPKDEKVYDEIGREGFRKYIKQLKPTKKMIVLMALALAVFVLSLIVVILAAIPKATDTGKCDQPSEIQNGTINQLTGLKHGDTFEIICNEGYELLETGTSRVTCLTSSHWGPKAYCEPAKCEPFVVPQYAKVKTDNDTDTKGEVGASINIACIEGYEMNGNETVICRRNRTWSISPICNVIDCGYPSYIARGIIKDLVATTINHTFSVHCYDGSILRGPQSVVCTSDGQWSNYPRCDRVACGMPPIPDHGSIIRLEGVTFNSTTLFGCDQGFVLTGNPLAVCQNNGLWSESPLCLRIVNGEYSMWTNWDQCTVTCDGGTQKRSRTCTDPRPRNGGAPCTGISSQQRSCNTVSCAGSCLEDTSNNVCRQPGEMCVDLNQKGTVTGSLSGITTLSRPTGLLGGKECSRQATFKVTFDKLPSSSSSLCHTGTYTQRRMLKVQMYFSDKYRHEWMFNIGDSPSNNGWAGDSGHTEYEAEIQAKGNTVAVYANNVNRTDCRAQNLYTYHGASNTSTSKINVWVANHYLKVANDNGLCERNCNKCLYGLNGQPTPGSVNQDIHVAANRVISGSYRSGYGLCFMKLSWVSGPEV